jgi:acetyltransferase-like isoleucine patch superfamily enzyme
VLGKNVRIEDYCIVGCPAQSSGEGEKTIIGDNAWIRSHTVIYSGNVIGSNFATGNGVNIRERNCIGDHVSIGTRTVVEHHVEIADHVRIHSQAFIPEYCKLEQGAWIGPNAVLTNAKYPRSLRAKENLQGVTVKRNAKVGGNSTILPGVIVGANSLVGAGSVVTHDVPDHSVVCGVPAAVTKSIMELPEYCEKESLG